MLSSQLATLLGLEQYIINYSAEIQHSLGTKFQFSYISRVGFPLLVFKTIETIKIDQPY